MRKRTYHISKGLTPLALTFGADPFGAGAGSGAGTGSGGEGGGSYQAYEAPMPKCQLSSRSTSFSPVGRRQVLAYSP